MIVLSVCVGSACHIKGAYDVIDIFQKLIGIHKLSDSVLLKGSFCLGKCGNGVSVKINDGEIMSVAVKDAENFFNEYIISRVGE